MTDANGLPAARVVCFAGVTSERRDRRWFAPAGAAAPDAEYVIAIPPREAFEPRWTSELAQAIAQRLALAWRSPVEALTATGVLDVAFVRIVTLANGGFGAIVSASGNPTAAAVQLVHDAALAARVPGQRYLGCRFDAVTLTDTDGSACTT